MVTELSQRVAELENEAAGTRALYGTAARQVGQLEEAAALARREAADAALLRTQLVEVRAALELANRRAESLAAKLAGAPDQAAFDAARAAAEDYLGQLRGAQARLASMVPKSEFDALSARLAESDSEKMRLRAELAEVATELETTEVFVENVEALPQSAKLLFMELSRLETVDPDELQVNYERIGQELRARVIDSVSFTTGSTEIDPPQAASVRAAMAGTSEGSFILVVGYASKTGTFDLNKSLSSGRATGVADLVVPVAKPGQMVRAVFFGQTDRFSSSDVYDDQICEVWEIRR
jgi:outer membrane protein OmpA-like peptidoglycan-associated protein